MANSLMKIFICIIHCIIHGVELLGSYTFKDWVAMATKITAELSIKINVVYKVPNESSRELSLETFSLYFVYIMTNQLFPQF